MKNQIISNLENDLAKNIGIIEAIKNNSAEILYASIDGIFIKEKLSSGYHLSVTNFELGRELLGNISECELIVAYEKFMTSYIMQKYDLRVELPCYQAIYEGEIIEYDNGGLDIREVKACDIDKIIEHYNLVPKEVIGQIIDMGNLFAAFKNEEMIGFVGIHLEGTIGLLEIFEKYRRNGYASILTSFMINRQIKRGLPAYSHIICGNEGSLALHKKLGFTISSEKLYWLFN